MASVHDQTQAGVVLPRFRASFTASGSGSVTSYEWQIRLQGEGWPTESTAITAPPAGTDPVSLYGGILSQTALQDFRLRAVGSRGASGWVTVPGLARGFDLIGVTASAGVLEASFTATAPGNAVFAGVRVFEAAPGAGFGAASQIAEVTGLAPGAAISLTVTGLTAGDHDYWMVPITATFTAGQADGPHSLNIGDVE
jgi:hypothetical protein